MKGDKGDVAAAAEAVLLVGYKEECIRTNNRLDSAVADDDYFFMQ